MAETKLLQDFIALAKTRSFTKAAELRHVTHPALSRRIKELEVWAGISLIDRRKIPVSLTESGHDLLVVAEQVIAKLNTVKRQFRKPDDQSNRRLRIGTGRNLARFLVADWACDVATKVGETMGCDISLEIQTVRIQDLVERMGRGQIDFLCCYEHHSLSMPINTNDFLYVSISSDKLVPICLNQHGRTELPNLEDEITPIPHIAYADSLALQRIFNDHLRMRSYHLEQIAQCDSSDIAHGLVKRNLGIAWLPWSSVAAECEAGHLKVLGNRYNEIPYEVRLYRPKANLSTAAELAWKHIVA